jgi:hypothetical protein
MDAYAGAKDEDRDEENGEEDDDDAKVSRVQFMVNSNKANTSTIGSHIRQTIFGLGHIKFSKSKSSLLILIIYFQPTECWLSKINHLIDCTKLKWIVLWIHHSQYYL